MNIHLKKCMKIHPDPDFPWSLNHVFAKIHCRLQQAQGYFPLASLKFQLRNIAWFKFQVGNSPFLGTFSVGQKKTGNSKLQRTTIFFKDGNGGKQLFSHVKMWSHPTETANFYMVKLQVCTSLKTNSSPGPKKGTSISVTGIHRLQTIGIFRLDMLVFTVQNLVEGFPY